MSWQRLHLFLSFVGSPFHHLCIIPSGLLKDGCSDTCPFASKHHPREHNHQVSLEMQDPCSVTKHEVSGSIKVPHAPIGPDHNDTKRDQFPPLNLTITQGPSHGVMISARIPLGSPTRGYFLRLGDVKSKPETLGKPTPSPNPR